MTETAIVEVEVEVDKLERLSKMYGRDIAHQIERARDALAEFERDATYGNWLVYFNITARMHELIVMRNAMRTHSDSFRAKFPTAEDVINQP
jgi:hypothetical protein